MAVYTEVSDEELVAFVGEYDIGEVLSCKGIAEGVENSNYLLGTTSGTFILTLFERRVRRDDLPFFLGLMEHVAGKGIPSPKPLKGRDGNALRRLCARPAAIVSFLEGMWPRRIRPEHCAGVGGALARFHVAAADFGMRRRNDLSLGDWRPLLESCADRADEVEPGLAGELWRELDHVESHWPTALPGGVIHGDLFPDNVFFRAENVSGMIDFYFACDDVLAYDLAVCLNAWCFEGHKTFNVTKARRLLDAYRTVRELTPDEISSLVVLARGAAMRFLLTRLYDWLNTPPEAMVTRKDPREFIEKLRFHQRIKSPGEYGLD